MAPLCMCWVVLLFMNEQRNWQTLWAFVNERLADTLYIQSLRVLYHGSVLLRQETSGQTRSGERVPYIEQIKYLNILVWSHDHNFTLTAIATHSGPHLLIKISYLYPLCQCSLSTAIKTKKCLIIKCPPSDVSLHPLLMSPLLFYLRERQSIHFNGEIFIIIIRKMCHFSGSSNS